MKLPNTPKELFQLLSDLLGALGGVILILYSYEPDNRPLFVLALTVALLSAAWEGNIWMKTLQVLMMIKIILIDRNLVQIPLDAVSASPQLNTLFWFSLSYLILNFAQGIEFIGDVIKRIGDIVKAIRKWFEEHDVK